MTDPTARGFDDLIVGAGFAGAVLAERLARDAGRILSKVSGRVMVTPRASAPLTIASASGCCDGWSAEAARRSRSPSRVPVAGMTSVRAGLPSVSVPVLSNTTVSTPAVASRAAAFLNSTPSRAPRPTPTVIAVGVASASASGQAITMADTAAVRANTTP